MSTLLIAAVIVFSAFWIVGWLAEIAGKLQNILDHLESNTPEAKARLYDFENR